MANPQIAIDFAKDISALIKHSHPKEQKELLKKFIKTVVISPGKATIHYRIPMPRDGRNPKATKRELALKGEPVSVRPTAHMTLVTRGIQQLMQCSVNPRCSKFSLIQTL